MRPPYRINFDLFQNSFGPPMFVLTKNKNTVYFISCIFIFTSVSYQYNNKTLCTRIAPERTKASAICISRIQYQR
jgi:hypothetical protein